MRITETDFQDGETGALFGLPYVIMRKPRPIDTTTLNYNWQIWETNAFSIYTNQTDKRHEKSAQEAIAAVLRFLTNIGVIDYTGSAGYNSVILPEHILHSMLTPAGGFLQTRKKPGDFIEKGEILGEILDPLNAEQIALLKAPTTGTLFFTTKKTLVTEHEIAFKVIPMA